MSKLAITQQPTYRVQPLVKIDKTREERREQPSFTAIYKAQTTKRERRVHILVVLLLLVVVAAQISIATGVITGPMYL